MSTPIRCFHASLMRKMHISGFSYRFQQLSQVHGQVTYVLLTRSPLDIRRYLVRLACIRHAASVHPEPGSNSPFDMTQNVFANVFFNKFWLLLPRILFLLNWRFLFSFQRSNRLSFTAQRLYIIPKHFPFVKHFFIFLLIFSYFLFSFTSFLCFYTHVNGIIADLSQIRTWYL